MKYASTRKNNLPVKICNTPVERNNLYDLCLQVQPTVTISEENTSSVDSRTIGATIRTATEKS